MAVLLWLNAYKCLYLYTVKPKYVLMTLCIYKTVLINEVSPHF